MLKQLLNISKKTFKKSKKRYFWPPRWSKWPSQRAKFCHKILILEAIYRPFELKIRLKLGLFRPKIIPRQRLNNSKPTFKKSKKRLFWPPKWSKWPSKRAKFWPKILILEVIYRPFELKINLKVRLERPKIMPKQFLNNSKTTFKKSKKRLFWPPKWPNHGYQLCQFSQKCRFLRVLWT